MKLFKESVPVPGYTPSVSWKHKLATFLHCRIALRAIIIPLAWKLFMLCEFIHSDLRAYSICSTHLNIYVRLAMLDYFLTFGYLLNIIIVI